MKFWAIGVKVENAFDDRFDSLVTPLEPQSYAVDKREQTAEHPVEMIIQTGSRGTLSLDVP